MVQPPRGRVLDAGADGFMPFEVQAGMDVVELRRRFGSSFCIMGGIDKRALACGRPEIEAEVRRVVPRFVESGRFIPTLDHTVPPDVTLESFRTSLDCVRSFERVQGRAGRHRRAAPPARFGPGPLQPFYTPFDPR